MADKLKVGLVSRTFFNLPLWAAMENGGYNCTQRTQFENYGLPLCAITIWSYLRMVIFIDHFRYKSQATIGLNSSKLFQSRE